MEDKVKELENHYFAFIIKFFFTIKYREAEFFMVLEGLSTDGS